MNELTRITCVDCGWEWVGHSAIKYEPSHCEECGGNDLDYAGDTCTNAQSIGRVSSEVVDAK